MGIIIISVIGIFALYDKLNIYLLLSIHVLIIILVTIILYYILMNKGIKEYRSINV